MSGNDYFDPHFYPGNFYLPGPSGINNYVRYPAQFPVQSTQPSTSANNVSATSADNSTSRPTDNNAATSSSTKTTSTSRKQYEKWSDAEQKFLVSLWADKFDRLKSKDARKVWEEIAREINTKFETTTRTGDKCKAKMKYLIDRYKTAKDWNAKQSGGHRRKSVYHDDIDGVLGCRDVITMRHVAGSGVSSPNSSTITEGTCDEDVEEEDSSSGPSSRKERKKKKSKKALREEEDQLERELLEKSCESLQEQRQDMTTFMQKFTDFQEQQTNTMNALVGALTQFLQK